MAEEIEPATEAIAILQDIADKEMFEFLDNEKCVLCGGKAYIAWDEDDGGNRFADLEFCNVDHSAECPIGRARQFLKQGEEEA